MSGSTEVPAEVQSAAELRRTRIVLAFGAWRSALFGGLGALLGILLAFGIDAWWDVRSERQMEREYLSALYGELVATRQSLLEHMESRTEAVAVMQHYLETVAASDPQTGSVDTLAVMLSRMAPYNDFAPRRAAFDDLVGSGGLRLIRSDTLRRALAAYEQAMVLDRSTQADATVVWQTVVRPYFLEHASMPNYAIRMRGLDEDIRPAAVPFHSDLDAFYGSRKYANLLMTQMFLEQRVRRRQKQLLRDLDSVLRLLNSGQQPPVRG